MNDERGSLTMAMLAVLMVGSVVTVLVAGTITGQRQTRFDQGFEQSLRVAEIGLDRMTALVESKAIAADTSVGWQTVDGGRWRAEADHDNPTGSDAWLVTAWGQDSAGVERVVQTAVRPGGVFKTAAFGKFLTDFNGGNGADSYSSGSLTTSGFTATPPNTIFCGDEVCTSSGRGIIATNGKMKLKGQTWDAADGGEIHFANERVTGPLPGATGYCDGVPAVCNDWISDNSGKLKYFAKPIELPPVTVPSAPTGDYDCGDGPLAAGVHVFTTARLCSSTVIEGTPTNPTIIYLTGTLRVDPQQDINFAGGYPRPSPGLQILSSAAPTAFDFGNHVRIAGALYGPDGAFAGGAQGHVYGSLQAGSIDNNGGWTFHFDEALDHVMTGSAPRASDWVELP